MTSIRALRDQRGISQKVLAELVGTEQPTIQRLEAGKLKMSAKWATKLAPHLGVEPAELMFPEQLGFDRVLRIPMLGDIQAGVWLEPKMVPDPEMIPIVDSDGYDPKSLYALRVKGDSMDLYVKEGGYVICLNAYEALDGFRAGMVVHVERRRFGGEMIEATLKEVGFESGKMILIPRSSNKAHEVIRPEDGERVETVEIRGLVVAKYEPAPVR